MRRVDQFYEMVAVETDDCIIWPYALSNGYAEYMVDGKIKRGHQVACEIANGPRPVGKVCAHNCGRAACINPRHLRWATQAENAADTLTHGTRQHHEIHYRTHLSIEDVERIREMYATGEWLQRELAERFGVGREAISKITLGNRWRGLDVYRVTPAGREAARTEVAA